MYWAAPVAFVIIGRIIEQKKEYFTMPIVIILVIGEILSQRMFYPVMPDFPITSESIYPFFLTPFTLNAHFVDACGLEEIYFGVTSVPYFNTITAIQYIFYTTVVILLLRNSRKRQLKLN